MDITKDNLLVVLLNITVPAIMQAILSNCYQFNDFVFAGHIRDKYDAQRATTALSAGIGIQIICFSLHNLIQSGAQVFIAQYYGAKQYQNVAVTFKVAFYTSIIFSSFVSVIGQLFCKDIASLTNSSEDVNEALEAFLSIILLASPAFGLMLLVDGVFKSCGNTRTPLILEIISLLLNTTLNYVFVILLNHGIKGTAIATAISRFIPGMIGLYGILHGWIPNLLISFNDLFSRYDNNVGNNSNNSNNNNNNDEMNELELVKMNESNDYIKSNIDEIDNELILETSNEVIGNNNSEIIGNHNRSNYISNMMIRSYEMMKLGMFESLGDFVYGFVFTCMIRYSGLLGSAQQAGLGAGMRGVEWIAFCVSEGFLISAITAVGQNIGAGLFLRAMHSALLCSFLSAFFTGILGIPFCLFSVQMSSMLSTDPSIIHYASQYVFINGFVMSCVGFEMASYGAMIGKHSTIIIITTTFIIITIITIFTIITIITIIINNQERVRLESCFMSMVY